MKCVVCREREAELPDRNRPDNQKRVCRQCHGQRLLGDLRNIARAVPGASDAETER